MKMITEFVLEFQLTRSVGSVTVIFADIACVFDKFQLTRSVGSVTEKTYQTERN